MKKEIPGSKFPTVASLLFLLVYLIDPASAAPADLDPTFGGDGKVTASLLDEDYGDDGRAMVLQTDGKIVVAGSAYDGEDDFFGVVRFNADGSLDTSFNGTGKVHTPIGNGATDGQAVALQADGKIVVAGHFDNGFNHDFAVVRYLTNGSMDTTFSTDGIATTGVGSDDDYAMGVAVQGDGKILVAGYYDGASSLDIVVVRFNTNGTLDTTFSGDGKATADVDGGHDGANCVAVQEDGKILVAGWADIGSGTDLAVLRFNTDGTLDNTFAGDGKATVSFGADYNAGEDMVVQSDGKIVVVGLVDNGSHLDVAVARFNSNGTLDTSFSGDGKLTTAIGSGDDSAYGVAVQEDGKILVAGYADAGPNKENFALLRYNVDGTLDTKFSPNGKVTTAIGTVYDRAFDVAVQPDGKIVLGGTAWIAGAPQFAAVRYEGGEGKEVVIKPPVANNSAAKRQLAKKIAKFLKKIKQLKKKGQAAKAKKLNRNVRMLRARLRAL